MKRPFFLLVCVLFWPRLLVEGKIGANGTCDIVGVLPFTNFGKTNFLNKGLGYSHLAAVRMAIKQFNLRSPEVVKEVAWVEDCDVTLGHNLSVDSQNGGHYPAAAILDALRNDIDETINEPCAIVGPQADLSVSEMSIIAQSIAIPLLAYGSVDNRLVNPYYHPYTTRTTADAYSIALALTDYTVKVHNRTNYIVILYPLTDVGIQIREAMWAFLSQSDIISISIGYASSASVLSEENSLLSLGRAAEDIKKSGYRTVIGIFEDPYVELQIMAMTAATNGISNGDYLWIIYARAFDFNVAVPMVPPGEEVKQLLKGSAVVQPLEKFMVDPDEDAFLMSWKSQGPDMVDEINLLYPIKDPTEPGYFQGDPDYFGKTLPSVGSGFLFDAVISIGLGGCMARGGKQDITSSWDHSDKIRDVDFGGSTGQVRFHNTQGTPGSRMSRGLTFGAFNVGHFDAYNETVRLAHVLVPSRSVWVNASVFYYADGTEHPPELLRDEPEQNFLPPSVRIIGFVLLGIAWSICVGNCIWVAVNRKHRVLLAAQPLFLYQLALGSAIVVSTIVPLSFDENQGWSVEKLSSACTSLPWLVVIGHLLQYMALFTKLWRIDKVLQFRRVKVKMHHVLWPFLVLTILSIIFLSIWTAGDGFSWVRNVLDEDTGESIGFCEGDGSSLWLISCVPIMIIPTALVTYMAWKTKDIDAAYSESAWIFMGIAAQLQVVFLSIPILVILVDVSSDARHIGCCLLLFCYSVSLLCVVMFPKYMAWWQAIRGVTSGSHTRGSNAGGVHVTGVKVPNSNDNGAEQITGSAEVPANDGEGK